MAEHFDNDISAFRGAERPAYQKVLRLARERKIDRVIVFHLTRMTRNRRERAEFIDSFHSCKVNVSEAQGGDYDLSTAAGRTWVDIQGVLATWESEIKSERITASAIRVPCRPPIRGAGLRLDQRRHRSGSDMDRASARSRGSPRNCRPTARGGDAAWHHRRAERAREPAPKSAAWGKTSVKKLAMRDSNVAQRIHHRGQSDEERFDGCWPPLVDRTKHAKVVALLTEPTRQTNGITRPGARRHLLSWGHWGNAGCAAASCVPSQSAPDVDSR